MKLKEHLILTRAHPPIFYHQKGQTRACKSCAQARRAQAFGPHTTFRAWWFGGGSGVGFVGAMILQCKLQLISANEVCDVTTCGNQS